MINYLLFITGFLIGIFIVLIIVSDKQILTIFNNYNYNETKEGFGVAKTFEETEIVKVPFVSPPTLKEVIIAPTNDDPVPYVATNTEIIDNFNFNKLLRKREMRLLITSYNNENIDINKLEWITDNKNYNNNIRLKLSDNEIVKEFNNMNPFVNGYNIHNVRIQGPANVEVYQKEKEISQFSILFMFMLKQFHRTKNNLFIIYGVDNKNIVINIKDNEFNNNNYYNVNNDINDNNDENDKEFDKNDINKSINLLNNYHYYENYDILSNKAKEQKSYKLSYFEKLYTIEIIIDDSVYNINDINMETLKRDITFFGLMMNKEDVVFHLNNTKYEFKRNNDKSIKIGKEPFVINKNKSCEIVLYSFAYFNEAISDADLKIFKLYNKYKLYGIHNSDSDKSDSLVKPNDNTIKNVEIKIPLPLSMKDIQDTEVNTLIATKEIANIKKI